MEEKNYTFQQAMNRLQEIVQLLDQGDLELEKAMELFIEGNKLTIQCQNQLNEFEKKMEEFVNKENNNDSTK